MKDNLHISRTRSSRTRSRKAQINWGLAWRYARFEMRGSVARFRVFLGALMLGVAAIGAVGSVADAMKAGISGNARLLLGGDFEISSMHMPADDAIIASLSEMASQSNVIQMRAMLRAENGNRKLVEMKAVDHAYPLVGQAELSPSQPVQKALQDFGAIVDGSLLTSLGLTIGDSAQLGNITVKITASLEAEPDNSISFVSFGPRLLVSQATLDATGLNQPGSFITYRSRFLLDDPAKVAPTTARLSEQLKDTHMRLRTMSRAAPGFDRFISRAELFLTLVGLTALLIGGLGISGGVRAWLASRMHVIATLKCLGAPAKMIFYIYMMQVMALAMIGIAAGLVIASLAPMMAASLFSQYVNVPLAVGIYPEPLAIAGAFGLVTTFVFAVWPLSRTRLIKAAHLFRTMTSLPSGWPTSGALMGVAAGILILAILAMLATGHIMLSLYFMAGTALSLVMLGVLGEGVIAMLRRLPSPSYVPARLALSAIIRPNSPLRSIIVAFGLGLSVLVAVTLSEVNLSRQISTQAQAQAPDWFFIDIQPDQIERFSELVAQTDENTVIERTPMLRGRVTAINGVSTADITPPEGSEWVMRGDRALTWHAAMPAHTELVRGQWWPADYQGAPLMSVTEEMFQDFGLQLGDTVSLNILGRDITAQIVNTRKVEWESFRINFVFIASPGLLDSAPHSWIATTKSETEALADQIENAIATNFSSISSVSVKQAVKTATDVLSLLGGAIGLTALVTLVSGLAVLAGTVATTEAQRLSDSIILKVLGATRKEIMLAWIFEYSLLGLLTALVASIIGSLASYGLIGLVIGSPFELDLFVVLVTACAGAIGTMLLGLAGAMRTLSHKPAPHLREAI